MRLRLLKAPGAGPSANGETGPDTLQRKDNPAPSRRCPQLRWGRWQPTSPLSQLLGEEKVMQTLRNTFMLDLSFNKHTTAGSDPEGV